MDLVSQTPRPRGRGRPLFADDAMLLGKLHLCPLCLTDMLHSKPCVALLTLRLHGTRALCVLAFLRAKLGVGEGQSLSSLSLAKCDSLLLSPLPGWLRLVHELGSRSPSSRCGASGGNSQHIGASSCPDAAKQAPGHMCNFPIGREGNTLLLAGVWANSATCFQGSVCRLSYLMSRLFQKGSFPHLRPGARTGVGLAMDQVPGVGLLDLVGDRLGWLCAFPAFLDILHVRHGSRIRLAILQISRQKPTSCQSGSTVGGLRWM